MKSFFINIKDNLIDYSAENIFENDKYIFLIESNKKVFFEDIIQINENYFDIKNNSFYIMGIINKTDNSIMIKYGYFSYCHFLYYYQTNNEIYLNLSLKKLLKDINIKPELNTNNVDEFVKFGYLHGDKCLIKNVTKLPALKTLIYYNNEVKLLDSKYIKNESVGNYVDNIKLNLPLSDTKLIIPLSGGYDSTLLTYLVKDYNTKIAFTAGSSRDRTNEFRTALNTVQQLNIEHKQVETTNEWIEYLPKIVDVMEGEMFDIGLFLCYAIVEELKKLNLTNYTILSGDGADQLLNSNFYLTEELTESEVGRYIGNFLKLSPRQFLYYIIIKKLEWLLHENNINYCLPFVSTEFYDCAKTIHSTDKQEYKQFVRQFLPKKISIYLLKRGGFVHENWFLNRNILQLINKAIIKYQNLFHETYSGSTRKLLYKLYIILFNYIFIEGNSIENNLEDILNKIVKED